MVQIILSKGKEHSLKRYHPWVFSGAIKLIKGEVKEGDVVEVYSSANELLGVGHYQIGSIAVRLFSFEKVVPDYAFWKKKLQAAYQFRKELGLVDNSSTSCYRLLFGEGDGMPGFIIDFYNGTAVFQFHSIGMYLIRDTFVKVLAEIMGNGLKAVYDKSEETLPQKADIKPENGYIYKKDEALAIDFVALENQHKFYVDWEGGQKTGFFIDQRENRELLARYSKDKVVLNTFCYTGGFSVYAAKAGAKEVHSTDISKKAIELTDRNIELNAIKNHQSFAVDTFEFLKNREKYV